MTPLPGRALLLAGYPVMRRPLRHEDAYAPAPNDPRFAEQWNLENRAADGHRGDRT